MTAELIDGKAVAASIRAELSKQVAALAADGLVPRLAVILVGDDAASASYVGAKQRAAEEVGIVADIQRLPGTGDPAVVTEEIKSLTERLNADPTVDGIILQLPVPEGVNDDLLLQSIDPLKDVDGLHPENQGRILQGQARYYPATPHGVQQLLVRSGNDPGHKHVVIVGRSTLVGLPLAAMLVQKRAGANATVTVCHTGSKDLGAMTRQADILIAAAGRPGLIRAEMVRPGAVVIDVGISRVDDATRKRGYRLAGDVDFDSVKETASFITPVPGGVGPMTVVMLLTNVVRSAQQFRRR
ncbi:MAG: tetrahydrofolate dehydrogenase/cyclohydrolase catalytic domain-containing protein [Dehalococcoidia bacterium]